MSTNAQILANRRNALKSTGPRTPQGKAAVSQNAVRHGLTAASDVISSESQAEFRLYRDQLFAELAPASPLESILAERVVTLSWRLKRVFRIQNQTIDALSAPKPPGPLAKLTKSFAFKTPFQPPQPDLSEFADRHPQGNALGRLAIEDFSNARVLDRLLMYERRIEHSLYKTLLELHRLNLVKTLNPQQ